MAPGPLTVLIVASHLLLYCWVLQKASVSPAFVSFPSFFCSFCPARPVNPHACKFTASCLHRTTSPLLTGQKARRKRPPQQAPRGPGAGGGDAGRSRRVRGASGRAGDRQGAPGGGDFRADQAASGRQQVGGGGGGRLAPPRAVECAGLGGISAKVDRYCCCSVSVARAYCCAKRGISIALRSNRPSLVL